MANRAIIAHERQPGWREERLGRVLDFFGVPWISLEAGEWQSNHSSGDEEAVFGSIRVVASILKSSQLVSGPRAPVFYAYLDDERDACIRAIELLLTGNMSMNQLAKELGITLDSLRVWKAKYLQRAGGVKRDRQKVSATDLDREVRELREENERLRRQREILKKALGILSDAPPPNGMP